MNDAKGSTVAHRGLTIGIIACAVVAVVGIALWMLQLSGGMIQTGMRNLDSWGFYITLFMSPKPFMPKALGMELMMRPPADRPTKNMNRVM